jgi:twitching motility two-component system response regulator PilH
MDASRTTTALLVDDEPHSRRAQQTRLEDEGYNVVVAQDQAEALARARQSAPKVIFIHLAATGPGNLGLIQALRSDDTFRHIPVVVIPNHLDAVAWRKKLRTVHRDVW